MRYILILLSLNLFTKDFNLYTGGIQSYQYMKQIDLAVELLEQGEDEVRFIFSENTSFTITKYLGGGGQSHIFETTDGSALRVRKNRFSLINFNPLDATKSMRAIDEYLDSNAFYATNDVKIAEVNFDKSRYGEYVISKRYNILYEFEDFLDFYRKNKGIISIIPKGLFNTLKDDFLKLAESTWRFKQIGDLRSDQIVYTEEEGWIILDSTRDNTPLTASERLSTENALVMNPRDKALNQATAHSPGGGVLIMKPNLPKDLEAEVIEVIKQRRLEELPEIYKSPYVIDSTSWINIVKKIPKAKKKCWAWLTKII